jgi:D-alanyl-D-alanine carboxypeptidase (penicillin-binding protein 5/6)
LLAAVVTCLLVLTLVPALAQGQRPAAPDPSAIQTLAPNAILVDAASGAVLFEKAADELVAPASLSKLMTMEYVFHEISAGRLKLDDEVRISENAWRRGGAPSGGSTMYAELNSLVKVEDLIQGAIVQSANDACIALAEHLAGGEAAMAGKLMDRARAIGLKRSTFANVTGLPDDKQRMTARELSILARHIQRTYPEFYKFYGQREFTWNKIRQFNRNPLLAMGIGADGMKTGNTSEAGFSLVGAATQGGLRLIVVVMGLKSQKDRADEARKLLEWGFRTFENRTLFSSTDLIGEVRVHGGTANHVGVVSADGDISLLQRRGGGERLRARIAYEGPLVAPVSAGQRVGVLRISRGEQVVLETPLNTAAAVPRGTLLQRAMDGAYALFAGLFAAGLDRL